MDARLILSLAVALIIQASANGQADLPKQQQRSSAAKDLARLAAGETDFAGVRLEVFWNYDTPDSFRAGPNGEHFDLYITVSGDGYGYWNDKSQFPVSKDQLRQMMKWLDEADIIDQRDGGREYRKVARPDGTVEEIFHPEVGRIQLDIPFRSVSRCQYKDHAGSPDFARLGVRLTNYCLEASRQGVGADSVADGLAKIRKKQLRPELLSVDLCRTLGLDDKRMKSCLKMQGGYCQFNALQGKDFKERSAVWGRDAGPKARDEIMDLLHEILRDESNPRFFAPFPTTIKVNILNQSTEIVGDRFQGIGTAAATQERFDRLCELLQRLEERTQKEGEVLPLFP